ncbi:MAG: F0F1 ATP synthase subunit A [SAR202 cluster bacterium]|nr:ATP synthase F0 subunit A [Chloroflexota bacterium]MQG39226.1 F0F1 ATP synthase subunit A [SAR202 cluster bacterium]
MKIKVLLISIFLLTLLGIFGGKLGLSVIPESWGGGFFSSPIAHIAIKAEPVHPEPITQLSIATDSSNKLLKGVTDVFITNTMIATWLAILILIVFAWLVNKNKNPIPNRVQGLAEIVIEFFITLIGGIVGANKVKQFLPLVMTIFLFIVIANWMGILPGYGTIGWIETPEIIKHHMSHDSHDSDSHADDHHDDYSEYDHIKLAKFTKSGPIYAQPFGSEKENEKITLSCGLNPECPKEDGVQAGRLSPYLRSANTDVNTTLAIAIVAMIMIHWWGLRTLGTFGHIGKFINFKEGPAGFVVGLIEAISELARLISFTFRLFGNIFAGEVLLIVVAFLLPLTGILVFLFLEVFVGVVQAFIFSILTLVFAATATTAHGADEH